MIFTLVLNPATRWHKCFWSNGKKLNKIKMHIQSRFNIRKRNKQSNMQIHAVV